MTVKLSGPMLPPKSGGMPKQLMVLLHGYGADGSDLIGLGHQWRDLFADMMFASPNAPHRCGRNPAGYEWFPLDDDDRAAGRIAGAQAARWVIVDFLTELWAQTGLAAKDTVLCGFSQGTMMALHVGTSLDAELLGIIGFSGALIAPEGFGTERFAKPPVALIHGALDQVVETDLSRKAASELSTAGFEVTLHISPGIAHGIAPDGLDFATEFLLARMG
ncbi:MAG: dienelactone hydrolase family protein [Devosia sp.]